MKRALAFLAGLVGVAALGRLLARRSARSPLPLPETDPDPADALRQRLESRRAEPEPESGKEKPPDDETLEQRRARVHAKAQEAISSMRAPDE